jgi:hypothetical protein
MSPIYKNIFVYRAVMNFLYAGKYRSRFQNIIECIEIQKTSKILELAFGDIQIAKWAKSSGIEWTGIDINESFVSNAIKNGYQAYLKDLNLVESFPSSDTAIIAGSLYHFHESMGSLIEKIMDNTNVLLISEPIKNISSSTNIFGKIAKNSANVNKGKEDFRFNEISLINELTYLCSDRYDIKVCKRFSKDIIIKISHIQK